MIDCGLSGLFWCPLPSPAIEGCLGLDGQVVEGERSGWGLGGLKLVDLLVCSLGRWWGGLGLVPGGEESDEWIRVLAGVLYDVRVEVLVLCVE